MSDVRALLAQRRIQVSEGVYLERDEPHVSALEEWLRNQLGRFAFANARPTCDFIHQTNAQEFKRQAQSPAELAAALVESARRMQQAGFTDPLLAEAFSIIREASRRILGKRHHDVQLLAGRALLQGKIAEMATGEGKTLAGALAVCAAAATGVAVHVVTVNDYLAERDAEENQALYQFFGLSIGVILQEMEAEQRQAAYRANIVYVSNKELTFDYLKDRISHGGALRTHLQLRGLSTSLRQGAPILRGLHIAIIDEADSVLIDEARTPLIISETLPDDLGEDVYQQAITLSKNMIEGRDFQRSVHRGLWLTSHGEAYIHAQGALFGGRWASALWRKELVVQALSAIHLFHRDQHYIIADDKVQIVDESTGRVMPDRTWERGLHQMIEAKEGCEISGQRRTLSQITYQRFFGRYLLLAGMTGTAKEISPELKRVYNLSVIRIPTHRPSRRTRLPDRVFRTQAERWSAVVSRAASLAQQGRAVLIGTRSVEASEVLGQLFAQSDIPHRVLNARHDASEADAVAQAGQFGRITIATNMAGRGTDIKLAPEVEARGGLHVILTEFHESARVDRQLFGRSARQGNPGSVEAMVCLADELFTRYNPTLTRLGSRLWCTEGRWAKYLFRFFVYLTQNKAERHQRRIRLDTLSSDRKWLRSLGFIGQEQK